jgi:3-methyladenine DNA glycosylase AlkC
MAEPRQFKEYLDKMLAAKLAGLIKDVYPAFKSGVFVKHVSGQIAPLELKERVALIAQTLRAFLPEDYNEALGVLMQTLGPEEPHRDEKYIYGLQPMPVEHFVGTYGLDHFEPSMQALCEITKRSSSEFAIRPFLIRYEKEVLRRLSAWVVDPNEDVRRLVSEGTRPRLPWAIRLPSFIDDPRPTLKLLEKLKDDPSEYVRRSVANHFNDITKDNADLAVDVLARWAKGAGKERMWMVRHSLRSLVKQGHTKALAILGFEMPKLKLVDFEVQTPVVKFGERVVFAFELASEAEKSQNIVIGYIIHFVKANGSTSSKVFKLTTRTLEARGNIRIDRKHPIKPITTRKYYSGTHRVEVQVNGQVLGGGDFELEML